MLCVREARTSLEAGIVQRSVNRFPRELDRNLRAGELIFFEFCDEVCARNPNALPGTRGGTSPSWSTATHSEKRAWDPFEMRFERPDHPTDVKTGKVVHEVLGCLLHRAEAYVEKSAVS